MFSTERFYDNNFITKEVKGFSMYSPDESEIIWEVFMSRPTHKHIDIDLSIYENNYNEDIYKKLRFSRKKLGRVNRFNAFYE